MKTVLYKRAEGQKILVWEAWTCDDGYRCSHGQQGGKMIDDFTKTPPKNVGRGNETTVAQQAIKQLTARIKKMKDMGYHEDVANIDDFLFLPMLASDYTKAANAKYIKFPCFAQKKMDGVRASLEVQCHVDSAGVAHMRTRKGKIFPHCDQIKKYLVEHGEDGVYYDGELFSDVLTFEELAGLVRKKNLKPMDIENLKTVYLVAFDVYLPAQPGLSNKERLRYLEAFTEDGLRKGEPVTRIKTYLIKDAEALTKIHRYLCTVSEGTILRNIAGVYAVNKRSKDLQKLKDFIDSEYTIIGAEEGTGRDEGTVIWICACPTDEGVAKFKCRPRGTHQARRDWWLDRSDYYGKKLTVRYQELTAYGIPRFPVGIAIRDYE